MLLGCYLSTKSHSLETFDERSLEMKACEMSDHQLSIEMRILMSCYEDFLLSDFIQSVLGSQKLISDKDYTDNLSRQQEIRAELLRRETVPPL